MGNLKNIYHFILPESKNELLKSVTKTLLNDTRVRKQPPVLLSIIHSLCHIQVKYAQQQQRKVQSYRGFSFPNDPLWGKQWSLV